MATAPALTDAFLDLVLGSSCVGCARPGRPLCAACAAALPARATEHPPGAGPPGTVPAYATGDYDGLLRALVIAHKERRVLALTRPLGRLLAGAVDAALAATVAPGAPVVLVPVPSRGRVVRARGHDPTLAMTRCAAGVLRRGGHAVTVGRLLRLRPGVLDQAGLDVAQRAANLHRSMAVGSAALRRLAATVPQAHAVVCDDVMTTGATVREAQRALEAVGATVVATACVAATPLRGPGNFPRALSSPPTWY